MSLPHVQRTWQVGANPAVTWLNALEADVAALGTGGGSAGLQEASLASQANAGVSTITVDHSSPALLTGRTSLLIIDPGSTSTELRAASSIAGAVVTLDRPLANTHAANARVIAWGSSFVPTHMFGCKGDGSADDEPGLQAGINETRLAGVYLEGFNKMHLIAAPLFAATGADLRHISIRAKTGYAPADSNNAMLVSGQDNPIAFTALASNDTFTTPSAHGIGGSPNRVAFKGASLPSPLVAGRIYYAKTLPTGSTLTIADNKTNVNGVNALNSATINVYDTTGFAASGTVDIAGVAVTYTGKTGTSFTGCGSHAAYTGNESVLSPTFNLTSDGSGTLYPDICALERLYLDDVFIDGNAFSGVNGIMNVCQQPQIWRKVRVDYCATGVKIISGQDGQFINLQTNGCGIGLQLGPDFPGDGSFTSMMKFYSLDLENCITKGVLFANSRDILIDGYHGETNPIHFHVPVGGSMVNGTFIQPHLSYTGSDVGWKIDGGTNTNSFQIIGHAAYGAAGSSKILNDSARGRDLLVSQLPDQLNFILGVLIQKAGSVPYIILDSMPPTISVRTNAPGLGSIAANSTATFTNTLTGALSTMAVSASPEGSIGAGLVWSARVSAADTVEIIVANVTVGAITPLDRNWRVVAQVAG